MQTDDSNAIIPSVHGPAAQPRKCSRCHPERSEGSAVPVRSELMQILRFAQNDRLSRLRPKKQKDLRAFEVGPVLLSKHGRRLDFSSRRIGPQGLGLCCAFSNPGLGEHFYPRGLDERMQHKVLDHHDRFVLRNLVGICLLVGWDLPCAVDDGKDIDLIRPDVVDDPERPFQNLPNLRDPEFCDLPPRQGELINLLRPPGQAVDNVEDILRRVPRDVCMNGPKMVARSVGPTNLHFSRP